MRTTVTLDPDVHAILRAMAEREGKTLGQIIGDYVRQIQDSRSRIHTKHGLPVLRRPKGVIVTSEMVRDLSEDN